MAADYEGKNVTDAVMDAYEALKRLEEWNEGSKGRWVNIFIDNGYGASSWEIKLGNCSVPCREGWSFIENDKPHGIVYASEVSFFDTSGCPDNVVYAVPSIVKSDWPGLAKTILAALSRAERLGI